MTIVKHVTIKISDSMPVSGLLQNPRHARACYVLAHGAGAGMNHSFIGRGRGRACPPGIGTLRYQFPYMERGAKRPDPPQLAQAAVRAAMGAALAVFPEQPLIAGGKSVLAAL